MSKPQNLIGFQPSNKGPEQNLVLVVILHAWTGSPTQMNDVVQAVREAYAHEPGLDFYIPALPYSQILSFTPATEIVSKLLDEMDAICPDKDPKRYSRIILIGHSLGAVIARRLFLAATDIAKTVPDPNIANAGLRHWVHKVERIISIGGLNRGWLSSGRLGWVESFVTNSIGLFGHLWPGATKPTIFEARRGAPFIVQTRLQWLALRRSPVPQKPEPLVIQLLGTQDNLVAPDDAVDFAIDRSPESPYFYVELPHTRHDNAIVFRDGNLGEERKRRFIQVLTSNTAQLAGIAIPANYLADTLPTEPNGSVEHVVFVIHGIRDDGYWTRKIAQKIHETAANAGKKFHCLTPSYGYFPMLPFLLPWTRRQKVEWLMDEYVGARSRFPNAEFSYVGHSNGTYLVARALDDYPAACFHNVLFAGSVVRRNYQWDRVQNVANMVATGDWVVAIFPQGLEPLKKFDLGGAGFGGFRLSNAGLNQVKYVSGGHSAGIQETQWPQIANFIVNDQVPSPNASKQSWLWKSISKVSTALLLLILFLVIAILVCILYPIFIPGTTATKAAMHTLLAVLYLIGLRFVVTRV